MKVFNVFGAVALVAVVAACTPTRTVETTSQPVSPLPPVTTSQAQTVPEPEPEPVQTAQAEPPVQQASLQSGNYAYIDSSALSALDASARSSARDAQFYALQFGRPGAPRSWSSGSASGQVTVGPYVTVNNRDCREFTHRVTVNGQTSSRSGTACRENGTWDVAQA